MRWQLTVSCCAAAVTWVSDKQVASNGAQVRWPWYVCQPGTGHSGGAALGATTALLYFRPLTSACGLARPPKFASWVRHLRPNGLRLSVYFPLSIYFSRPIVLLQMIRISVPPQPAAWLTHPLNDWWLFVFFFTYSTQVVNIKAKTPKETINNWHRPTKSFTLVKCFNMIVGLASVLWGYS